MKRTYFLFTFAILSLIIVIADLVLWIWVTGETNSFEEAKQQYLAYYPVSFQNARMLTVISILMLTASGFIFLNASKTRLLKIVAAILGVVSAILLMWKIFSLM